MNLKLNAIACITIAASGCAAQSAHSPVACTNEEPERTIRVGMRIDVAVMIALDEGRVLKSMNDFEMEFQPPPRPTFHVELPEDMILNVWATPPVPNKTARVEALEIQGPMKLPKGERPRRDVRTFTFADPGME
jgi:hypothetical protein